MQVLPLQRQAALQVEMPLQWQAHPRSTFNASRSRV